MHKTIRKLREARGISQSKFAHMLNINYTQYNKYETGRTKIPAEALISIAKALDVSVDYILSGKEEPPSPRGLLKDEVFANMIEVLASTDLENFSEEELTMLRGAAKLIIERVEQRRTRPRRR
jgi:transcriptional regulator with XRE-family HTH domain